MTPLEKAVEAITAYHGGDVHEDDKEHARIAIRAFLEAAAEDGNLCITVECAMSGLDWSAQAKAAILALKETING